MEFAGIVLVPKLIDHTAHINNEPIIQGSGIKVFDANQPADPPSTNKNTVYKRLFLNEIPLLKISFTENSIPNAEDCYFSLSYFCRN